MELFSKTPLAKLFGLGGGPSVQTDAGLFNQFANALDVDKMGKTFSKVCASCVSLVDPA